MIYAEQIFGHDQFFAVFDIMASRLDNMMYSIAFGIDKYVLNNLLTNATTSTYTTPTGGFTTGGNINTILGNLLSKVAGFQNVSQGTFLVIENTDLPGFAVAGATSGFSVADSVLRNGLMNQWMGTDIYVVRSGTFVTATLGTTSVTNNNMRVFGVKGVSTYASPRGLQYEEKGVSGKTGKEVVVYGEVGFKLWTQSVPLIVAITLA